ncbi:alpha/beta hydrolase [Lacticigenium naphthae]|uniref:alpha/beta hydrolase n=1 Tax=Lacticigenium naphthae TaxID=515351 RepID=UPI0003FD0823|nr:alpha/beta fold hydrolase [Lacticigenium naphthae]
MRDRTFYFEKGPKAIILFHAFSSTPNDMRSLGRSLEREGYTVYAPTFSGHGTADPDDVLKFGPSDWVEDGKKAIQFLKEKGFEEIAVFGLSLGGIIATKLLLEESITAAGVFSSPVMHTERNNVIQSFLPYYQQIKQSQGMTNEEISKKMDKAEERLKVIFSDLSDLVDDMETQYENIEIPVFIAQGGRDQLIDPEIAEAFKDSLKRIKPVYHLYKEAPHVVTVGDSGRQLQDDLIKFLKKIEWNGGK